MTTLADQEAAIVADLTTIRELWDQMLPTLKAIPLGQMGGGSTRSSTDGDDHNGDHNRDVDNLDVVISDRGLITNSLRDWGKVIIRDFNITTVIPHGHDIPGMCTFHERWARHMTGHPEADKYASALHWCATRVLRHAKPTRKDWLGIGVCPLKNDETGDQCGGNIRAKTDGVSAESWATCQKCGTRAVVSWWEHQIFGGQASRLVNAAELREFIHAEFGKVVGESTVRSWVRRQWIEPVDSDHDGRQLFDKGVVAYVLQRRRAV